MAPVDLNQIQRAFENREFVVYLQPQQNSMSKQIVGFEALARWEHPEYGLLKPGAFLPIMTQNNLIPRLDTYIWEETCTVLERWCKEGRKLAPIAVNMTLDDIKEMDVVGELMAMTQRHHIDPKLLHVEITESVVASSRENVASVVSNLREQGFRVYMDDFGSGYSSLGMLKDTQFDALKLDMSLIDFKQDNFKRGMSVLSSVTNMAHRLGLPLIVEGVQSQGQIFILQSLNCLYVQGFYFKKPLPIDEAEALLTSDDVAEYWDIDLDRRTRNTNEMGAIDVDATSALTLRSYKIFADSLMLNALFNLESAQVYIAQSIPEFTLVRHGEHVSFDQFCHLLFTKQVVHPGDIERMKFYLDLEKLKDRFYCQSKPISFRFRIRFEDDYHWVTLEIIPNAHISPDDAWCVISVREDALAEQLVAELDRAYSHDLQTGLLNRNKYEKDLAAMAKSEFGSFVCVYIDAVGLHEINNLNGHAAGDAMLQAIADTALRHFDRDFIYRIGGDEFVIFAANCMLKDVRTKIATMRAELRTLGYEISVGTARAARPSELSDSLSQAEKAMRTEKEFFYNNGGGAVQKRGLNEKLEEMIIEKQAAERFLRAFLPETTDIIVYNLNNDGSRVVAASPKVKKLLNEAEGSFRDMLEKYRDTSLAESCIASFNKVLNFRNLKKKLLVNGRFTTRFERNDGTQFDLWVLPYSDDPDDLGVTMWVFSQVGESNGFTLTEAE